MNAKQVARLRKEGEMMRRMKAVRMLLVLLCALLAFSMVSSLLFAVAHAGHDCIGKGCPICLQMSTWLRVMRFIGMCGAVLLMPLSIHETFGKADRGPSCVQAWTPVWCKVKLTN